MGSGAGISQIKAKTLDFGASDAPLDKAELDAAGLIQFPMVIGGVVLAVNLPGIKPDQVRLTPDLVADIYLGKVTKWSDPRIAGLNKNLSFPKTDITPVYRADGSGTTWLYTNYLDKVSATWHKDVGTGKSVKWPLGIGGKGNEGVGATVQRVAGAIGYVELSYALQNKMAYTKLSNKSGNFVSPSSESFQSAAQNADWKGTPGLGVVMTNADGLNSWPIAGASFILMQKEHDLSAKVKIQNLITYFEWALQNGQKMAAELDYVPIPSAVVPMIRETWRDVKVGKQSLFAAPK